MTWKTYTCHISDMPALILVDSRFAEQAPLRELPRLSWFGVYYNQPVSSIPENPNETESLDKLEGDLIKLWGAFGQGWAVYVLRIETPGICEYYVYHSDEAELNKAFLALKAIYPNYRIEYDKTDDPDWKEYTKYVFFEPKPSN